MARFGVVRPESVNFAAGILREKGVGDESAVEPPLAALARKACRAALVLTVARARNFPVEFSASFPVRSMG